MKIHVTPVTPTAQPSSSSVVAKVVQKRERERARVQEVNLVAFFMEKEKRESEREGNKGAVTPVI